MKNDKLKPLSAFEWASVSRYIIYISRAAQLQEINSNDVVSFPLARVGVEKVLVRKVRVLASLEYNQQRLECFVGLHKGDFEDNELSVIRSLYLQFNRSIETVNEHIGVAKSYREALAVDMSLVDVEVQDDIPF